MNKMDLLRIISEELEEYRTYSQETPVGKGQVSKAAQAKKPRQSRSEEEIQGFPDELPVNIGKATALQRYSQEQSDLEDQIKSADSSVKTTALQGKLDDITREKNKIAMSEIHSIFEEKGLSTEQRIETLESLMNALFEKDPTGAGYTDRLRRLELRVDNHDEQLDSHAHQTGTGPTGPVID
ncbi:MAG: hypothetical protein CML56_08595 [Rhodobacteraceae bacterium]|nr:hypothetical protein [Paracoccaceae bacterium]